MKGGCRKQFQLRLPCPPSATADDDDDAIKGEQLESSFDMQTFPSFLCASIRFRFHTQAASLKQLSSHRKQRHSSLGLLLLSGSPQTHLRRSYPVSASFPLRGSFLSAGETPIGFSVTHGSEMTRRRGVTAVIFQTISLTLLAFLFSLGEPLSPLRLTAISGIGLRVRGMAMETSGRNDSQHRRQGSVKRSGGGKGDR